MPSFDGLPEQLQISVVSRLPCAVPRNCFESSSRSCLRLSRLLPLPSQLPWLLTPSAEESSCTHHVQNSSIEYVFCVQCSHNHRVLLRNVLPGSRYIGCPWPEWISISRRQLYDHFLVNARTGQTYLLPDLVLLHVGERPSRIILRASTLSQEPILGSGCLVANICTIILSTTQTGTGMVCFSSLGSGISNSGIFGDFEDVIFFSGAFYTVSRTGQMFLTVANPTLDLPSVFQCWAS